MNIWKRIYNAIIDKPHKPMVTFVNRQGTTMAERLGIADRRAIELQAQASYLLRTPPPPGFGTSAVYLGSQFDVNNDNELFYITWWSCDQNSKHGPVRIIHAVPEPSLN